MTRTGVSRRKFAELDGCSETLVRRGLSQGKLIAFDDGTIDPALAGTPWRKANAGANTANTVRTANTADADSDAGGENDTGELLTYADAQRLKENNLARKEGYQSLLRKLEHEVKSGRLVDGAQAEAAVFTIARVERDAWVNWPSRVAPLIAADLGIDAVALAVALERYVREHLAERAEPRLRLSS